jgi:c-di-GMP-binding flagellar brake protein YcgR
MSLSFRPDMKAIVHEVDGDPVTVIGKTIDGGSTALVAMMETAEGADRLRPGARVRCSYVDPQGVHEFVSAVLSAETLALNHRLMRLTIAAPNSAERLQRREHVRVELELPVELMADAGVSITSTSVDLSAGGMCMLWPDGAPDLETGSMVEVRFTSERFEHHHQAQLLGSYVRGKATMLRLRFEGITPSGQDRLATVVFAAQREMLRRQRESN